MNGRSSSLAGRPLLAIRVQEADQRIAEAADRVVTFLAAGRGRLVDTALSSDEVREIVVVGYVVAGAVANGTDAKGRNRVDG